MKIMYLAAGNSIHTVRWVNELSYRNHEVHLVLLPDQTPTYDAISEDVRIHELKYGGRKGYYLNAFELRKIIKKISPDIINAHYASGYGTLGRISNAHSLVLSVWGSDVYDFPYKNYLSKYIVKKNLRYADKIASTSIAMANQVRKLLNDDKLDIAVTPFGVNLDNFYERNFSSTHQKIKIGIIKTLAPKYGITDLIKAMAILKEKVENIELEIYGDGPQREDLEQLIIKLGLTEDVFLKGKIPNNLVPKVLATFDIFCVSSYSESFGVAVVEAMAASLPVVATDADGFLEVVKDNETGLIAKRNSPEDLSSKLQVLVENPELRKVMGIEGRKRASELYDWQKNVTTMEELYQSILDEKGFE